MNERMNKNAYIIIYSMKANVCCTLHFFHHYFLSATFYSPHVDILHISRCHAGTGGGEGGWLKSTTVANLAAAAGFITDLF